jgi:hypothetical protein
VSLTIFEKTFVAVSFSFTAGSSGANGLPWPTRTGWIAVGSCHEVGLGVYPYIYFYPHAVYNALKRAIVQRGLGAKAGGIPVNTLYAMPAFASSSISKSHILVTGTNHDSLHRWMA